MIFPGIAARCVRPCATGRSALALAALDLLSRGANPVVRLPFYCCPSVAQPFAESGFDMRFYSQGADLSSLPDATPDAGDVFLFIHWFGFPNRAALAFVDAFGANRPFAVIEDCVPASLWAFGRSASTSLARSADYSAYSFRKVLPVPDGALLASQNPVDAPAQPSDRSFVASALAALRAARRTPGSVTHLRLSRSAEARLDADASAREASPAGIRILRRCDGAAAAARRRENARLLASLLPSELRPLHLDVPEDAAPLCLPVLLERGSRDELLRRLRAAGIVPPLAWDVNPEPGDRFAPDRDIARRVIALPVGQEIDGADVERLGEILRSAVAGRL